jgi:hypothetical protein
MGNDVMNPSAYFNLQYTGATIAYIESMGFFAPKSPSDKMEEVMQWGYKAGCKALEDYPKCSDLPMSCKKHGTQCSMDYYSVGSCSNDLNDPVGKNEGINGCQVFKEKKDCRFMAQKGDRCIEFYENGTTRNATCGQITCIPVPGPEELYDVIMEYKNTKINCKHNEVDKETIVEGDKVLCP